MKRATRVVKKPDIKSAAAMSATEAESGLEPPCPRGDVEQVCKAYSRWAWSFYRWGMAVHQNWPPHRGGVSEPPRPPFRE